MSLIPLILTQLHHLISLNASNNFETLSSNSFQQEHRKLAIYAHSSVIFPHRMGFGLGEADAVNRGPKLNRIKKLGKGGGEVTLQL